MACQFSIKSFNELSTIDLYYILQARAQVFVIEQKKIYQDIDEVDFDCLHLVAHKDAALVGYTRIIPPIDDANTDSRTKSQKDKIKDPVVIDRVFMLPEHRGYGLAHRMMAHAIGHCRKAFPKHLIKISTQTKLTDFYSPLGFKATSQPYVENGTEYIDMTLDPRKKVKIQTDGLDFPQILSVVLILLGLIFIAGLLYLMPD